MNIQESQSQESQHSEKVEFENGKYIMLVESEPGVFLIQDENVTEDNDHPNPYYCIGFKKFSDEMDESLEILDEIEEEYNIYGISKHFKYGNVEVNVSNPMNSWIKSPTLEEAKHVLQLAHPEANDPRSV